MVNDEKISEVEKGNKKCNTLKEFQEAVNFKELIRNYLHRQI